MPRRGIALRETILLIRVENWDHSHFAGIWNIELVARQPFVQKPDPSCKGAGWRHPDNRLDCIRVDCSKKCGQYLKVCSFIFEGKDKMRDEGRLRTMARREHEPRGGRSGVMPLRDRGHPRRRGYD